MDRMAYNAYTNRAAEEMFRYKFRIHFSEDAMSDGLSNIFRDKHELLKSFFRLERDKVLRAVSNREFGIVPKTMDNLVYLCNELWINDEDIKSFMPMVIASRLEKIKNQLKKLL